MFDPDFVPSKHMVVLGFTPMTHMDVFGSAPSKDMVVDGSMGSTPIRTPGTGSNENQSPIYDTSSSNLVDKAGDSVFPPATIMNTFGDPGGVGLDISSFSFDVDGVADLFTTVGGGMEEMVQVGLRNGNDAIDDPRMLGTIFTRREEGSGPSGNIFDSAIFPQHGSDDIAARSSVHISCGSTKRQGTSCR